jgi:hypothetical protein
MSFKKTMLALTAVTILTTGAAYAGPRVNEVNSRVENQQKRIDAGVQNGTINAKQEAKDEKALTKVETKESADQAKDGGHITKKQQRKLNRRLNKDSTRIKDQKAK